MKKTVSTALCVLLSALVVGFSLFSIAAYSADEDPLITLSYLNEIVIPKLKNEIKAEIPASAPAPTQAEDTQAQEQTAPPISEEDQAKAQNLGTYETLELNAGQTLLAKSALELIVRPGSIITAVSPFETQGVADITNGVELYDGDEFAINAYCIIPRGNDGRGIRIISEKAYILIRGEYEIG